MVCVVVAWVVALVCCEGRRRSLARPRETDPAGFRLRVAGRAGGGRACGRVGRVTTRGASFYATQRWQTDPGHRSRRSADRSCDRSRIGVSWADWRALFEMGSHSHGGTMQGGLGS